MGPLSEAERARAIAELAPLALGPLVRRGASTPRGLVGDAERRSRTRRRGAARRRASRARVSDVAVARPGPRTVRRGARHLPHRGGCERRARRRSRSRASPGRASPPCSGVQQAMLVFRDPPQPAVAKLRELRPRTRHRDPRRRLRAPSSMRPSREALVGAGEGARRRVLADQAVADAGGGGRGARDRGGRVYTGINLDLACGIGFCAEHSAVAEMLKSRETVVRRIVAVNAERIVAPCGRCRELLVQVDPPQPRLRSAAARRRVGELRELLPNAWLEQLLVQKRAIDRPRAAADPRIARGRARHRARARAVRGICALARRGPVLPGVRGGACDVARA